MEMILMNNLTKLDAIQLRFQKDIGELNNKRKELLISKLNEVFDGYDSELEKVLLFFDLDNEDEQTPSDNREFSQGLVVSSKGLTFLLSASNPDKFNFTFIKSTLKTIFDALLLETNEVGLIVELVKTHELGENESAMDSSLSFINSKVSFNDVQGVGLRLFVDNENFTGEYKIEPYLDNLNEIFVNYQLKMKDFIAIEEIEKIIDMLVNDLIARTDMILLK